MMYAYETFPHATNSRILFYSVEILNLVDIDKDLELLKRSVVGLLGKLMANV